MWFFFFLVSWALCWAYWFTWSPLLVKASPFPFLENVRQQKGFWQTADPAKFNQLDCGHPTALLVSYFIWPLAVLEKNFFYWIIILKESKGMWFGKIKNLLYKKSSASPRKEDSQELWNGNSCSLSVSQCFQVAYF